MLRLSLRLLAVFALWLCLAPTFAQSNLLANAGFEQGAEFGVYQAVANDPNFNVAPGWSGWITFTPRNESWQNVSVFAFPHPGQFKRSGGFSQDIGRSGGTFTASIFQTVANIPAGTTLRASVFAYQENESNTGARTRIGIGTGNDPQAGGIVWSNWMTAVNTWQQISVEATTTGGDVTVFIYFTQDTPNGPLGPNKVYLDDAALIAVGTGTPNTGAQPTSADPAAPPPPTSTPVPAIAAFVSPQGARPDGSIVHVVQSGDTLSSIAFAYGVTLETLRTLNNTQGSFLRIGQEIIVATAPPNSPTPLATNTPAVTNTPARAIVTNTPSAGFVRPTNTSAPAVSATPAGVAIVVTNTPAPRATNTNTPAPVAVVATATHTLAPTQEPTSAPTQAPTNTTAPTVVAQAVVESTVIAEVTDAPSAPVQTGEQADPLRTTAEVCVLMFDDRNQNRLQNPNEGLLEGGLIVLRQGTTDLSSYLTNGISEPFCFTDLPAGSYTIASIPPEGYGLTTPTSLVINAQIGTSFKIAVGAAQGVRVASVPTPDAQSAPDSAPELVVDDGTFDLNSIAGILVIGVAVLMLLGGLVLALIIRRWS